MNQIKKMELTPAQADRLAHPDKAFEVIAMTDEGNPYTFATIYKNKHGRTNLTRVGRIGFLAGSKNGTQVKRYAATVSPDTTDQVFIEKCYGGYKVRVLEPRA